MSRTLTISDGLYARLEQEAQARGLSSVERLLEEEAGQNGSELSQRARIVCEIDNLRERLFGKYGVMADSTDLIREDRAR